MLNKFVNFGRIVPTRLKLSCGCALWYMSFVWTEATIGLMVVFDKENVAVISTGFILKVAVIWRSLYCHNNPRYRWNWFLIFLLTNHWQELRINKASLSLTMNNIFVATNKFCWYSWFIFSPLSFQKASCLSRFSINI